MDLSTLGTVPFDTYYSDPLSANVMTAIADNWKTNIGLTVELTPIESAAWQKHYYEDGESQALVLGSRQRAHRRSRLQLLPFLSRMAGRQQRRQRPLLQQPRRSTSCSRTPGSSSTRRQQDAIYQQVCEITKDDLPNLYLWQSVRFHVVSNKAQNVIVIPAAGGGSYYDAAEKWTVTE